MRERPVTGISGWMRAVLIVAAGASLTACISYPSEPRYSTRATPAPAPSGYPPAAYPPQSQPYPGQTQPYQPGVSESPPPATAPVGSVEGGALPPTVSVTPPAQPSYTPAPVNGGQPGAAYVIQPGDTISGVGRRFQTPVQTLIDLNGLGPRGAITSGQRIILPDSAVDTGRDPYATGPSPAGVLVPNSGVVPPPPPPPSGNPALPALHGGAIGGYMECAGILHLLWSSEALAVPKTIDFTIDYLLSGRPQDTYANVYPIKLGKRVSNLRIEAWQTAPAKPIAVAVMNMLMR
jgi:LysM repeat protein